MVNPGSLGGLLRRLRQEAGLTQQELAERAVVSLRTLRDIEVGRVRRPRAGSMRRLAAALPTAGPAHHELLTARMTGPAVAEPAARVWLGVLGPLAIRVGEAPLELTSPMQRDLLGLLALRAGEVVPRDEIVEMLWAGAPPRSCSTLVHVYVSQLRRALEPGRTRRAPSELIVASRGGYLLRVEESQLDLAWAERLAVRAAQAQAGGEHDRAYRLFEQALAHWRGAVLVDSGPRLRHHPVAVAATRRRLTMTVGYADLALATERYEQVAERLAALAYEEPLHEGLHARLMLALAGSGRQAEALRVFADIRRRLGDELGVQPGAEIQQAHLSVVRQQPSGSLAVPMVPAWSTDRRGPSSAVPAQLPADVVAFSGRTAHVRLLDALLAARDGGAPAPVVMAAIVGTAGIGKTALAVHWAHRVRDRFPDGQLYVNLRGCAEAAPVRPVEALARFLHALGVPPQQVPVDVAEAAGVYRTLMANRRMLVLLDNAGSAEQVRPLLPGSPTCRVLVTSRSRLGGLVAYEGARGLILDVLAPEEATALVTRTVGAERVRAEPEAVAELARLCAYLPLALRIATANLTGRPARSIADYAEELRCGNRLASLVVEGDDQAAIRAAFDLSYVSLPADARGLFRLLGLAPGPDLTVEAAAALAGASGPEAARLLDRMAGAHLIDRYGTGRYGFHDLLRRYAAEVAAAVDSGAERDAAVGRLLRHYLSTVDNAARLVYPESVRLPLPAEVPAAAPAFTDHAQARAWLDAEYANLLAAIRHASASGPAPLAWLLASALNGYFKLRRSVVDWLASATAAAAAADAARDLPAQAATQLMLGDANRLQDRFGPAGEHYQRGLEHAREAGWLDGQAAILVALANIHWQSGRLPEAARDLAESLALYERTGRLAGRAALVTNLGLMYQELGQLREAAAELGEATESFDKAGSVDSAAVTRCNLGETLHWLGRSGEALESLAQALSGHRAAGSAIGAADTQRVLATVHRDAGRYDLALELARGALAGARDAEDRRSEADGLNTLGSVHRHRGETVRAAEYHEWALALARDADLHFPAVEALVELARTYRTADPAGAIRYAQQALGLAHAAGYRMLEGNARLALAAAALVIGDRATAADQAGQALAIHAGTGYRLGEAQARELLGDGTDHPAPPPGHGLTRPERSARS
jgi:DNA-binding SARP family transcriptional activator/tetratricopeptide (TPR) repeat protein/DNA-binding XRE family transcriptional regulator